LQIKLSRKNSRSLEDISAIGIARGSKPPGHNRWSNQPDKQADDGNVFLSSSSISINTSSLVDSQERTTPIPAARTSKQPRLGQSSLSQSCVIPASTSGLNLAGVGTSRAHGEVKVQQQHTKSGQQQQLQQQQLGKSAPQQQQELPITQQQQRMMKSPQQQQQQQHQVPAAANRKVSSDSLHPNPHSCHRVRNCSEDSEEGPPPPPRQYRDKVSAKTVPTVSLKS